jgi:peptide/nickel transport system permease protein
MAAASSPTPPARRAGRGRVLRLLGTAVRTRRGMLGACLATIVILIALVGPFVSSDPLAFTGVPYGKAFGNQGLLGTDSLGRDVLARTLSGGWRLLLLAVASTAIAIGLGAVFGVVAAYRRGMTDAITMRAVDILLAVPQLVFVLLLLSVVGPKIWLVIVAVGFSQAPQVARVLYAAAQDVVERDFVKAVAVWGVPPRTVIRRHVLPSLITPLTVECGIRLSGSIVLIAGLGFLGLGTSPPNPDWGVMINENRLGLAVNPWGVLMPVILLGVLAVGTNMFSDAIARVNIGDRTVHDPILASVGVELTP